MYPPNGPSSSCEPAAAERHLLTILAAAMRDPALSGGCSLLADLFAALSEEPAARSLMAEIPAWKIPGLMLSAALLFQAGHAADHPLAPWLGAGGSRGDLRAAVRRAVTDDRSVLAALCARHTYQCNPPRRMAVSLLAAAPFTREWEPCRHIDLGTASGIGLLLGDVRVETAGGWGPQHAALSYPVELRGALPDLRALRVPPIEESVGIDLDPPDLADPANRAWMRACQYPLPAEWEYFDRAVDLALARKPRIEKGSATTLLPLLAAELPAGRPLLVTDSYVAVFMSEPEREALRAELATIARLRPVVWVSNNSLVPSGAHPVTTTAGLPIPPDLRERNRRELFGTVCVTTWTSGRREARIVGVSHPGACWLEWREEAHFV